MSEQSYIDAEYREIIDPKRPYEGGLVPQRVIVPFDRTVPDPRIPCVLLVDTSSSMRGERIAQVNRLLDSLKRAIDDDPLASQRLELCVVAFNDSASVIQDFALCSSWNPSVLTTGGLTAMGAAIDLSLDLTEARKMVYLQQGHDYYRPWLILLTDGEATDEEVLAGAARRIKEYQRRKKIAFVPIAIGNSPAMFQTLAQITNFPIPFDESKWDALLAYLLQNFRSVSQSDTNEIVSPSDPRPLFDLKAYLSQ